MLGDERTLSQLFLFQVEEREGREKSLPRVIFSALYLQPSTNDVNPNLNQPTDHPATTILSGLPTGVEEESVCVRGRYILYH